MNLKITGMKVDQGGEGKPHRHGFKIDAKGNGQTTSTLDNQPDHVHQIRAGKVLEAGDPLHGHAFLSDGKTVGTKGAYS